ncbi:glucose 1-dehydrogenase [Paenibacillus hemerocallicola]|jgi:NAD(P)-dependent dehydrogenase (short-subunit alcohol dehydrogenase family)|uniref:Glucose 1-dehydrogenase n=1 Tax=Paenibacillus hemerocallicola TaxID=1172614 RepID=A0A5C4TA71_9BACL|nr:glucose 1-dehydrogenase [Paenibacillus hemerocallicola]TNJ65974.1 glucose 1-dehydrogenase [Paenibacillus hemerocallicola]
MVSPFDLQGRTALVTGGSKGIGFGMASALIRAGAKVAIAGRNQTDGVQAARQLCEHGGEAHFFQADVTDKAQVDRMVRSVAERFGRIDILVNNAGMNIRKPLLEVEESDWDAVMSTNLKGIFLVGQSVVKQMAAQNSGSIVNVSSVLGGAAMPNQSSYAASKGGVNQLTKVWAAELARFNIKVNAIAPAYIRTPMTEKWLEDPVRYKEIVDSTLMGRVGDVSELAGPVVFLASSASSYMTGHILYVDGGWLAK